MPKSKVKEKEPYKPRKSRIQSRLTHQPSPLLSQFPEELLDEILSYLDERSNVRALLTCRKLYAIAYKRVYKDVVCVASSAYEYEEGKISIDVHSAASNHNRLFNLQRFKKTREAVNSIKLSAYFAKSDHTFWRDLPLPYGYTTKTITLLNKFPNLTTLSLTNHHQCYTNTTLTFDKLSHLTLGVMNEEFAFTGMFVRSRMLSNLKLYYHLSSMTYSRKEDLEAFALNQLSSLTKRYLRNHKPTIDTTIVAIRDNRSDPTSLYADFATCSDLDTQLADKVGDLIAVRLEISNGEVRCVE